MSRTVVFRRPDPQQGRALEVLGHAVEYLVDSYSLRDAGKADLLAISILHKASLDVFAECKIVIPFRQRLARMLPWASKREPAMDQAKQNRPAFAPKGIGPIALRTARPSGVHKIPIIS
jgi:hypothetical protein